MKQIDLFETNARLFLNDQYVTANPTQILYFVMERMYKINSRL